MDESSVAHVTIWMYNKWMNEQREIYQWVQIAYLMIFCLLLELYSTEQQENCKPQVLQGKTGSAIWGLQSSKCKNDGTLECNHMMS